jgi:penicillin-binding protein 1A
LYPAGQVASVRDMMQSVVQQGTASRYGRDAFTFEVAGKTGSSPSDSWFVGFNPEHLLLAWAGYDKPSASSIKELPLFTVVPFWVEVMSRLETSREFFVLPSKLIPKEFCRYEGCVDSPDCAYIRGFFVREADLPPCPEGG